VIFATWFTYDFDGAALPLSATLTRTSERTYSGSLIRTSGPPFFAVPFDPAAVERIVMGTATVGFENANEASFSYDVRDGTRGTSRTKAITRQVFREPGTACH
jgi:hypothetical protein